MNLIRAFRAMGAAFALVLIGFIGAHAIGNPPLSGGSFALIDQTWLNGLAGGQNWPAQSGISAAGTTQATATPLALGVFLYQVDTASGSATGIALPSCLPGIVSIIYNNTATNLTIYPAVANNPVTGVQDTINNATTLSLTAHTQTSPACAKNGIWGAS